MGYWFPPSPKSFEPVARPLGYSIEGGIHVPDPLDVPLLEAIAKTPLGRSIGPAKAYDLLLRMRPPPDASATLTTEERIGGWGSQSIPMRRWCTGDLPEGGLPPDSVNPDGTITRHYWDLADGARPYRKCVTEGAGPKGQAWLRVMYWDPDKGWLEEGGDLEKEAVQNFKSIMDVIFILVRMVASATGVGAPAAAIMGIMLDGWKLASSQIQIAGWEPPTEPLSAGDVFASLGGNFIGLAAEIGRTDAFGDLANRAQKTFTSLMTSAGAYPMIKGLESLGGSVMSIGDHTAKFILGVGNVTGQKEPTLKFSPDDVVRFTGELLSVPTPSPVAIQVKAEVSTDAEADPTTLISTDYRKVMWEAACLGYVYPDQVLRIRRNAIWKYRTRSTPLSPSEQSAGARGIEESSESALECGMAFDGFLSQMYANQRAPKPSWFSASEATDWSATASYKQVLARGRQSAAVASDPTATRSFRQVLAQGGNAAPVVVSKPSTRGSDAAGIAFAALVLYRLFRMVRP